LEEEEVSVRLDRLLLVYEAVTESQFDDMYNGLTAFQHKLPWIYRKIGVSIADYHLGLHIGSGEGSIYIGFKHNSASQSGAYKMKIEWNPAKEQEVFESGSVDLLFSIINSKLWNNKRVIRGMDIAFDLEVDKSNLVATSLTGRNQDRRKGTIYYGDRNNDGFLKIYDKKKELKEKQKKEIEAASLTRIEYSWRHSEGLKLNDLSKAPFRVADKYKVALLDPESVDGTLKGCLLSYVRGEMDLKEFPRRTRENIKKALTDMEQLALDTYLEGQYSNILLDVKKYITGQSIENVS